MEAKIVHWGKPMISQVVFMVEEESMERFLKIALNKLLPGNTPPIIIPHEGKTDLENSIPRKLRAWKNTAQTRYIFFIIRDKDSGDCTQIKQRLMQMCANAGRDDSVVIIAVHELESWFLGDLRAVEKAYHINGLARNQNKKKYKQPDRLANASEELMKISKDRTKVERAEKIVSEMDFENNCSHSFNFFLSRVKSIYN